MEIRSLSRRAALALASALAFAVTQNSFAQQKTQAERRTAQEVFLTMQDEPPSMDPTKQADTVSGMWLGHIFEGLMTTDKSGNIVPGTAEKMAVSADGKTYTFTIRKNAKWHDGKPVTAQDFEFTFKRLVDPAYASEYSFIAETAQIVGAADIIAKKAPVDSLGVKAVNDSTLEIKLNNPVAFFPSLMSFNTFFPVRKDLVEKHGDKFATNVESLVGNGPFKLARWQKEASMRIEKAPTYWNAAAIKLKAIEQPVILKESGSVYNLYKTGGLDITWSIDAERVKLAQKEKVPVKSFNDGGVFFLEMNQRKGKLFEDPRLRKAIQVGVSRGEYVSRISAIPGDRVAHGLVPDYMPGSKKGSSYRREAALTFKDNNINEAKKLVKEYLTATKQTKIPSFTILSGDTGSAKRDAEYYQSVLAKVFETDVKVDTVPFKTRLQKMRDGQFDIVLAGWGPDYLDAMTFMDLFLSNNPNNHGGFADAKFDELIKKAQTSGDLAERVKTMHDAEKLLITEKAAVVPYYQRARAYLQVDGLQGVRRTQVGADPDLRYASWSTTSAKK